MLVYAFKSVEDREKCDSGRAVSRALADGEDIIFLGEVNSARQLMEEIVNAPRHAADTHPALGYYSLTRSYDLSEAMEALGAICVYDGEWEDQEGAII